MIIAKNTTKVEEALATPHHLKIQTANSDVVKAHRSLSNT